MSTITSANSVLTLAVNKLFPVPQVIQGYAVDDAFEGEAVQQAEILMGVDGVLSAGKVFVPYKMTIHLQADSPSVLLFDTLRNAQNAAVDVYSLSGSILLPGTSMVYTLQNGFLTMATPFPAVKKTLQPLEYEITWQQIIGGQI
jgi:molecular chaperone DnaK (HSP70)